MKEHVVNGPVCDISDLDVRSVIYSHAIRVNYLQGMSRWHYFRSTMLVIAVDQVMCPMSLDGLTIFGLRPPELYFIKSQVIYLKCFEWFLISLSKKQKQNYVAAYMDYCKKHLHKDYQKCSWFDATGHVIKLRVAGLPLILQYIDSCPDEHFDGSNSEKRIVRSFFGYVNRWHDREQDDGIRHASTVALEDWKDMKMRFLCAWKKKYLPMHGLPT